MECFQASRAEESFTLYAGMSGFARACGVTKLTVRMWLVAIWGPFHSDSQTPFVFKCDQSTVSLTSEITDGKYSNKHF